MALKTKADLITETTNVILTGGRRTTAANLRTLIGDTYDSIPNLKDGGMLFEKLVGYSNDLLINNQQAFVHKQWVEDNFATIGTFGTWSQVLNTGANTGNENPIIDTDDFLLIGSDSQRGIIHSSLTVNPGIVFFNSASGETANMRDIGGWEFNTDLVVSNGFKMRNQTGNSILSLYGGAGDQFLSQQADGTEIFAFGNSILLDADGTNTASLTVALPSTTIKHSTRVTLNSPIYHFTTATANRAAAFNGSSDLVAATTTLTELNYLSGVTSSVQAQFNALQTGQFWKAAALVATTGNITLSGEQTIDGVLTSNSDVLVWQQTNPIQNGIYTSSSGAWTRRADFDSGSDNLSGATLAIQEGSTYAEYKFTCSTNNPITIGVTNITFVNAGGTAVIGTANRITVTGNVIDIAATYVGQSSITTLGTITAGTWNGTAIGPTYIASMTSAQLATIVSDEVGTGNVVFNTAPTFVTSITSPLVIGGTAVGSSLNLQSTTGNGTTTAIGINFLVGNNGATNSGGIYNNGTWQFGTATSKMFIPGASNAIAFNRNPDTGTLTNSSAFGYQWSRTESTTATSDTLGLTVYNTAGSAVRSTLFINGLGNVGIGTNSPTSPAGISTFLHISGSTHAGIAFTDTDASAGSWEIWTDAKKFYSYGGNGNYGWALDAAGNFGLGNITPTAKMHIQESVINTGSNTALLVLTAAHTAQTAGTNVPGIKFTLGGKQWATGTVPLQNEFWITQPTYSAVGSSTFALNGTVVIDGAPASGTNIIQTITAGLIIKAGAVAPTGTAATSYGALINAQTGATTNYSGGFSGGNGLQIQVGSVANSGIVIRDVTTDSTSAAIYGGVTPGAANFSIKMTGGNTFLNAASSSLVYFQNNATTTGAINDVGIYLGGGGAATYKVHVAMPTAVTKGYLLSSADITHGMTAYFENTNTVFQMRRYGGNGGTWIQGASQSDGTPGFAFEGTTGTNTPTAMGGIVFCGNKKSGTSVTKFAAAERVMHFGNGALGAEDILFAIMGSGKIGFGVNNTSPSALIHGILTTEQMRLGYDTSNYLSITVGSAGSATLDLTGTTPSFNFSKTIKPRAGTATANTAPVEFTSGPVETTARGGLLEYNNAWYITKNSTLRVALGGIMFTSTTDGGNTTTTETDLYTYTTPTNTLEVNGAQISATYAGTFVSSATATRQLRVYFAGTNIYDSAALSVSTSADWCVSVTIIRLSSTAVNCTVNLQTTGASGASYSKTTKLTGITLSNTNILKITGQAAGVGAATNDIVLSLASGRWDGPPQN